MRQARRGVGLIGLSLLCLLVCGAYRNPPRSDDKREIWVSVTLKGQKVGYSEYVVTHPTPTTQRRFAISVFKSRLLGQEVDIDSTADTLVDAGGEVISGTYDDKSSGRTMHSTIQRVGHSYRVTSSDGKNKQQTTLTIPEGSTVRDDPSFELFGGETLPQKSFYVFDAQNMSLVVNSVTVEPAKDVSGAVTMVKLEDVRSPLSFYLGGKGDVVLVKGPFDIEMRPSSKVDAETMTDLNGDLADASLIRVENAPPDLSHLKLANWVMTGAKIGLPSDDNITFSSDSSGQVINTHPFREPDRTALISKVKVPDKKWLASEPRVDVTDPTMIATAKKFAQGEKHLWAAAQKIREGVHRSIGVNAGIGILRDAREVWASKEGVCRDHAVLMLTLLRAIGIPTRMCCGLVYDQGSLYYHAWVEAYDGHHWLGVDSTRRDEFLTVGHIKTAEGTASDASTGFLVPGAKVRFVTGKESS